MSGGNIWIQMGDEETPDPGNLTHLASDREQKTGDRRGPVRSPWSPTHSSWEHGEYFHFFLLLSLLYSGSSLAVVPTIEVCI